MIFQKDFHGGSMGFKIDFYGIPMVFPLDSYGMPQRHSYGISMRCLRDYSRIAIESKLKSIENQLNNIWK